MEYVVFNYWLILHRAFEESYLRNVSVKMSHMSDMLQKKKEKETVMKTVISVNGDANKI